MTGKSLSTRAGASSPVEDELYQLLTVDQVRFEAQALRAYVEKKCRVV